MIRRWRRAFLHGAGRAERPAAWVLLFGALATLLGTIAGVIAHGEVRWATLLVAADLLVSGWADLKDAYDDELETP